MNIVSDLLDAYAQHIFLPLSIVNKDGRILYSTDAPTEQKNEKWNYESFIQTINVIERPTLSSVYNQHYALELFYFISPYVSFENSNSFIIAGPFQKSSSNYSSSTTQFPLLTEYMIDEVLNKFSNLYYVIQTKQNFENNKTASTEWLTVMHDISHNYFERVNEHSFIYRYFIMQLSRISTVHFAGIALQTSDGVFEITDGTGEHIERILHKKFYIGEGLLGNAISHNKSFLWDVNDGQFRIDFFNRHNMFP